MFYLYSCVCAHAATVKLYWQRINARSSAMLVPMLPKKNVPCTHHVENGGPVAEPVRVHGISILNTAMCFRARFLAR